MKEKSKRDKLIESFDKTLSKHEHENETYLEWSNETLGKCVRHVARLLSKTDTKGYESIKFMAAFYTLINVVHNTNAANFKTTLSDVEMKGDEIGTWEIIVKKIETNKK